MSRKRQLYVRVFISLLMIIAILQGVKDYINEREAAEKEAHVVKTTEYSIFIEIEDKMLYLLQDGKCIKKYPISSGKSGYPSPLGFWKITSKSDWGEGFGGRWMELSVPWGIYGIHGTIFPESIGTGASSGCFRMFSEDVAELYDIVSIGTPVIVVNGVLGPFGSKFDEINPGDRGADVMAIERRLGELGYYNGELTGIYEDDLKKAVHDFQRKNKLEVQNTITKKDWLAMGFRDFE